MNAQHQHDETQPASQMAPLRWPSIGGRQSSGTTMVCLSACIGLQMTSFVMILPLFARRFAALGAGVSALGFSEMAYALAATVAAPFMGILADRFGRRPVVLLSLAAYAVAFTGYLLAESALAFIILRGMAGALTAGLMPAATSMVADLAPEKCRAQWIGVLSGGASVGWILGPILGGLLYDRWGYGTALLVSISMAVITFGAAAVGLRETGHRSVCQSAESLVDAIAIGKPASRSFLRGWRIGLPGPLGIVLFIYFAVMFAWAFVEPRFMFYAYDQLGWSSSMLGLVMSTYGISLAIGEFGLGRLSDNLGRKPVIMVGLILFSAQFLGLALSRDYIIIAAAFVVAGLGNALFDPALSASILDVVPSEHQGRILGVKGTMGSIGNILGPASVAILMPLVHAQNVFMIASAMVLGVALLIAAIPMSRRLAEPAPQPLL